MKKHLFLFLLMSLPIICAAQKHATAQYKEEIAKERQHEDSLFKFDAKSPLTPEAKAAFQGLPYFPVDQTYRVKAKFLRTEQEGIFKMPTTGTRAPEYVKYGELHFQLQGQPLKLSVYQNQELIKQPKYLTYLFIPFTDATTGQETYGTGRYLDFSIPMGTDSVWLDFNRAYNPYCAYGDGYSCPIPPKENKLPIRIEAGVKTFEKGGARAKKELVALPEYPGGEQMMQDFLYRKFAMPLPARKAHVSGTVVFSFLVKPDGSLSNFEVLQSVRSDVDRAVLKAAKQMPNWKPSELADEVKMTMSLQVPRGRPDQDLSKASH